MAENGYHQIKDALFRKHTRDDDWPCYTCKSCRCLGECCQRHHHHHLDNCVHCGNDERDPRRWLCARKRPIPKEETP